MLSLISIWLKLKKLSQIQQCIYKSKIVWITLIKIRCTGSLTLDKKKDQDYNDV